MNPEKFSKTVIEFIKGFGFGQDIASILKSLIVILVIIIIAIIFDLITKKIIIRLVDKIIRKSKNQYDDIFLINHVFDTLSHIVPALIVYKTIPYALSESYSSFVKSIVMIIIIIIILKVLNSILNALHEIYLKLPISKSSDIKGYVQVVKIIISIFSVILIFSILLNKSPVTLLTSLGAATAILLLIFKDTILGFVAGIQLSVNGMLKIGDWISVPSKRADGNVIEITLNTVKVQNFDKTITTIPTYSLVSEAFTNWTGMQKSGGRRIKRSINIDINTIKFCTKEMLDKFEKIDLLKEYISEKKQEIFEYNNRKNTNSSISPNIKQLTNIGTFRIYVEKYLRSKVSETDKKGDFMKDMTLLVRQLQSTEKGLPIEIYVFASSVVWTEYEKIQSNLFDRLFAIIPEFELKVFQNPSGRDFAKTISK